MFPYIKEIFAFHYKFLRSMYNGENFFNKFAKEVSYTIKLYYPDYCESINSTTNTINALYEENEPFKQYIEAFFAKYKAHKIDHYTSVVFQRPTRYEILFGGLKAALEKTGVNALMLSYCTHAYDKACDTAAYINNLKKKTDLRNKMGSLSKILAHNNGRLYTDIIQPYRYLILYNDRENGELKEYTNGNETPMSYYMFNDVLIRGEFYPLYNRTYVKSVTPVERIGINERYIPEFKLWVVKLRLTESDLFNSPTIEVELHLDSEKRNALIGAINEALDEKKRIKQNSIIL